MSKVAKVNLMGILSSDLSGSISVFSNDNEDVNDLLALVQYSGLANHPCIARSVDLRIQLSR